MSKSLDLEENFLVSYFENSPSDPVSLENLKELCEFLATLEPIQKFAFDEYLRELASKMEQLTISPKNPRIVRKYIKLDGRRIIEFTYDRTEETWFTVEELSILRYNKNSVLTQSITILNNKGNILLTCEDYAQ